MKDKKMRRQGNSLGENQLQKKYLLQDLKYTKNSVELSKKINMTKELNRHLIKRNILAQKLMKRCSISY